MSRSMWIILGMALVTYIPRVIPFVTISERKLPRKLKLFLEFVPFTALGALIIPGVFTAIDGRYLISLAGISVAFALSWKKGGMILPVISSIAITFLLLVVS